MKPTAFILLLFLSLSACSKQDSHIVLPGKKASPDQRITLGDFSGTWDRGIVHLQFSLSGNLSGITAIKIFSGSSSNQLCIIGELSMSDFQSSSAFSFIDQDPKSSPAYYMIGIEDNQGHVTYLNNILSVLKPTVSEN